jgi:hypothetical protein
MREEKRISASTERVCVLRFPTRRFAHTASHRLRFREKFLEPFLEYFSGPDFPEKNPLQGKIF